MLIAHVYKLRPTASQSFIMDNWLSMLRAQYNFRLAERITAFEQTKTEGAYCDIRTKTQITPLACSLSKYALYGEPFKIDKKTRLAKRRSGFELQCADLVNLKAERPWYAGIYSIVLQQMLRQLDAAYKNFFEQGRGYPKFKRRADFKSFTYTQNVKFEGGTVLLPGIGWMCYYNSRPFPDGFQTKSVTVRKKASGWYISVRLEDKSVPEPTHPCVNEATRVLGIDVGIAKLVSTSTGLTIPNPRFRFSRNTDRIHQIRHRRVTIKLKGSKNKADAQNRLSKLDERIARHREDYHWNVANKIIKTAQSYQADFIAFEDLNIQNMVKRASPKLVDGKYVKNGAAAKCGLNRVILDAGWGELKIKVKSLSSRAGITVIEVNPRFSSQECSCCHYVSLLNRDKEKFLCEACGHMSDADIDAAIIIEQRGLDAVRGDTSKQGKSTPTEISMGLPIEPGNQHFGTNPVEYIQMDLFGRDVKMG